MVVGGKSDAFDWAPATVVRGASRDRLGEPCKLAIDETGATPGRSADALGSGGNPTRPCEPELPPVPNWERTPVDTVRTGTTPAVGVRFELERPAHPENRLARPLDR